MFREIFTLDCFLLESEERHGFDRAETSKGLAKIAKPFEVMPYIHHAVEEEGKSIRSMNINSARQGERPT